MSEFKQNGSFREGLLQQAKEAARQAELLQQPQTIRTYHQQKTALSEEGYDTSQLLTYEEGVDQVKGILKKDLTDTLEENMRQRANNVIVSKNKVYFKKRIAEFHDKIERIVREGNLRLQGISADNFIEKCTAEIVGWDILDDAFSNPKISDIFVYKWNKIFVEVDGEKEVYPKRFRSEKHYKDFLDRITFEASAKSDKGSHKISDFELFEDRFCLVNQMISPNGTSLTIRKHSESHIRLSQMIEGNCLDDVMAELFRLLFKGQCSIIYAGATGSGKTTSLRALVDANITDLNRRILTCEDTRELFLENSQTLELTTYKANQERDSVYLDNLVTTSLRLKPDLILVGEIRSVEAESAVEAAATGHATTFTMHAGKPFDAINRLVMNYQKAMPRLSTAVVERMIGTTIDIVVIQKNIPDIGRRIVSITEIGYDDEKGRATLTPLMQYDFKSDTFKVLNGFSEDMKDRMLGAGVKWHEMEAWLSNVDSGTREQEERY